MGQLVGSAGVGKEDVVTVGLGALVKGAVGEIDEDGEICEGTRDLSVVYGDGVAVGPGKVIPKGSRPRGYFKKEYDGGQH